MHRIDTPNRVLNLWGAGKDGWRDGNKAAGISPTELNADFFNATQEELVAIVEAAGITPSTANNAQVLAALRSTGVFQTRAQFDNTTAAATTSFVQRALGNMSGISTCAVSTALSINDVGKWIIPLAGGIVFTLPPAGSCAAGARVEFYGNGQGCTIVRSGTDLMVMGASALTSIVLGSQDRVSFLSSGGAWYALGGEAAMGFSSSFGSSLAANGYQKLPSGLIIQWGAASLTITPSIITLPVAFPAQAFGVLGFNTQDNPYWPNCFNLTTTQFTAHSNTANGGLFYIAIGK